MSYTVITGICEGFANCIPICQQECIHRADPKVNAKGTRFV